MARLLTRREAIQSITLLTGAGLFMLTGCERAGSQPSSAFSSESSASVSAASGAANSAVGKIITVYFSHPETGKPDNMTTEQDNSTVVIDGTVLGNVQYMAQTIQQTVGGDIFRIEPAVAYSTDHETVVDQASDEKVQKARPVLASMPDNLSDYDTVFLGYPIWWADLPMVLYTFLGQADLSGKTIVPFVCHGGSGFAGTRETIAQIQSNANILADQGLAISRNDIQDEGANVASWAQGIIEG